jgi:hypothetical protein
MWNSVTKSIIYKKYSQLNTFQVVKSFNNILDEVDAWMVDIKDFRYIQSWKSGVDNVIKSVNSKFLMTDNGQVTGLRLYSSGRYLIGTILDE